MSIQDVEGMNIAEIIAHHGRDESIINQPFVMYRDEYGSENLAVQDIQGKLKKYAGSLGGFKPLPLDVSNAGVIIFTSGTTGVPKGIEVTPVPILQTGRPLPGCSALRFLRRYMARPMHVR